MKAFPVSNETGLSQQGMDLRDYFAAKVLQSLLCLEKTHGSISNGTTTPQDVCDVSYRWAELLIGARK